MKKYCLSAALGIGIVLGGCGALPVLSGDVPTTFSLLQIDENVQKRLPIVRKASFGTLKIAAISLQPGLEGKTLDVLTKFVLTSFEIPEGIEGLIGYQGRVRYDPASRRLYLSDVQPTKLTFGNPSLEEYVSSRARKGIVGMIASTLKTLPLLTMPEGFRAKGVERIEVQKDQLRVDFN